jgi:hypothetical protein
MAERNLILNASAVLWRRSALLAALKRCEADLQQLQLAGDWRLYGEILAQPGAEVAYVARPLNQHRRHPHSVTARLSQAAHTAEIGRMHDVMARVLGADSALRERQRRYRRSVAGKGRRTPPVAVRTPA